MAKRMTTAAGLLGVGAILGAAGSNVLEGEAVFVRSTEGKPAVSIVGGDDGGRIIVFDAAGNTALEIRGGLIHSPSLTQLIDRRIEEAAAVVPEAHQPDQPALPGLTAEEMRLKAAELIGEAEKLDREVFKLDVEAASIQTTKNEWDNKKGEYETKTDHAAVERKRMIEQRADRLRREANSLRAEAKSLKRKAANQHP